MHRVDVVNVVAETLAAFDHLAAPKVATQDERTDALPPTPAVLALLAVDHYVTT